MAVHVHFITPRNVTPVSSGNLSAQPAPAIGVVRKREAVALAAVSTASALAGEVAIIANEETTSVLVAWGSTPDAAAVTATTLTSAGLLLAAGQRSEAIALVAGAKISAKVVS
jgi:predicted solute-binding protein